MEKKKRERDRDGTTTRLKPRATKLSEQSMKRREEKESRCQVYLCVCGTKYGRGVESASGLLVDALFVVGLFFVAVTCRR